MLLVSQPRLALPTAGFGGSTGCWPNQARLEKLDKTTTRDLAVPKLTPRFIDYHVDNTIGVTDLIEHPRSLFGCEYARRSEVKT